VIEAIIRRFGEGLGLGSVIVIQSISRHFVKDCFNAEELPSRSYYQFYRWTTKFVSVTFAQVTENARSNARSIPLPGEYVIKLTTPC
jgi:hypothetical protein